MNFGGNPLFKSPCWLPLCFDLCTDMLGNKKKKKLYWVIFIVDRTVICQGFMKFSGHCTFFSFFFFSFHHWKRKIPLFHDFHFSIFFFSCRKCTSFKYTCCVLRWFIEETLRLTASIESDYKIYFTFIGWFRTTLSWYRGPSGTNSSSQSGLTSSHTSKSSTGPSKGWQEER